MRTLAVDVGARRIGLALSDELGWTAQPLPSLEVGRRDPAQAVAALAVEREASAVVVGLPLNMNGSDSRQTAAVRDFAERLRARLPSGVALVLWDERLTSRQSERTMGELGVRRRERRQRSDQIAAQLILQTYLDAQRTKPMETT
jgi:putative Holliday junction resolvase